MFTLIKHAIGMRRVQSVATIASVAISCAVVFALLCSYMGVQAGLDKSAKRMGADLMAIPADAAVGLDENSLLFTGVPANMYMNEDVSSASPPSMAWSAQARSSTGKRSTKAAVRRASRAALSASISILTGLFVRG